MADADRDKMLRDMAANRNCRLVKSRKRTPGAGDYGRYGLKHAASDAEVFGFGKDGLTASPEEIEAFLRKGLVSNWRSSLAGEPADGGSRRREPHPRARAAKRSGPAGAGREPPRPAAPPPSPPPPRRKPQLRIVARETERVSTPPPPAPRPILEIREARAADAEGIAALLATDTPALAARLAAHRQAGEPALVADEGGEILGCAAWHALPMLQEKAPLGRITLLLVAPEVRRRGIGRSLVEEVEARLAEAGCSRIEALAEIDLAAAPDFFRRLGWARSCYRYARDL